MDVAGENGEIGIFVDKNALVSALIEMSRPVMTSIEVAGVGDIEFAHEFGKIAFRCLDQQMKMVVHKHVAAEFDGITREGLQEYLEKPFSIVVVPEDFSPLVAPARYMINGSLILDAKRSGHGRQ